MHYFKINLILILTVIVHFEVGVGQPPNKTGFIPETGVFNRQHLAGIWINTFFYNIQSELMPKQYWQQITFTQDGVVNHSYFSGNPQKLAVLPYTQIISEWQIGIFSHPETPLKLLPVIRFQPIRQINYDAEQKIFQHINGNFGPQFRRFFLQDSRNELVLSELVVLEIPGNDPISFPESVHDMTFTRVLMREKTSITQSSWSHVKERAKLK